ncbi:hypothetical protein [Acinetobacter sp. TGL-Y2]|uniref:hypothetical protein n=1 Tax=Acinetobacter sp. TGL-Y2 TaxID=1407071 RepID=UPI000AB639AD|nr:hypothetical protein [Acinetobacter sp. TGL-Y2]
MSTIKSPMSPILAAVLGGGLFFGGYAMCLVSHSSHKPSKNQSEKQLTLHETNKEDVEELQKLSFSVNQNYINGGNVSAIELDSLMQTNIYRAYKARPNVRAVIDKAKADGVITGLEFEDICKVMVDEYNGGISPSINSEQIKEIIAKL